MGGGAAKCESHTFLSFCYKYDRFYSLFLGVENENPSMLNKLKMTQRFVRLS